MFDALLNNTRSNHKFIVGFILLWTFVFIRSFLTLQTRLPDTDTYFIIATGKHIVETGKVATINPFVIHSDLQIIVQQWLFDVIIYHIYNTFGFIGLYMYSMIILVVMSVAMYMFFGLYSSNIKSKMLTTILFTALAQNLIVGRPTSIGFLLCLSTLFVSETYRQKHKWQILLFLPLISIIMINIHASLWPMLFVLILPFIFPTDFPSNSKDIIAKFNLWFKQNYQMLCACVCMFVVGFINPNGIRGMFYLILSYESASLNNGITEMASPSLASGIGAFIVASAICVVLYLLKYKKDANLHLVYMSLGTIVLAALHQRNFWFLFFGPCVLMLILQDSISINSYSTIKRSRQSILTHFCCLCLIVIFAAFMLLIYPKETKDTAFTPVKAADYLDQRNKEDIILYTEFNNGAYMEFREYKVYIDARPELFQKKINGMDDIYTEYLEVRSGTCDISSFINKYNFTHMVVENGTALSGYMQCNQLFEIVVNGNGYKLYQRIDNK